VTSRSSELFAAAQERIPGGVNSPVRAFRHVGAQPFFVERARGAKIWDVDGNEYIDYIGSWGPAILGHTPKVIVDAVREAAARPDAGRCGRMPVPELSRRQDRSSAQSRQNKRCVKLQSI